MINTGIGMIKDDISIIMTEAVMVMARTRVDLIAAFAARTAWPVPHIRESAVTVSN